MFLVEGEKDADRLRGLGLTATTTAQGAKGWPKSDHAPLAGRHVVLLPDNDDAGRAYAAQAGRDLDRQGRSLRRWSCPGCRPRATRRTGSTLAARADELRHLAANAPFYDPPPASERPATPAGDYSHDALALAVGERYADHWRHVDLWGHWYLWTGTHWQRDDKRRVWTKVREFARVRATGLDNKAASRLRSAETIAAVVNLARSNREFAAGVSDWDRDEYLLGTPGGTVDLRTGDLREARPADRIAKLPPSHQRRWAPLRRCGGLSSSASSATTSS